MPRALTHRLVATAARTETLKSLEASAQKHLRWNNFEGRGCGCNQAGSLHSIPCNPKQLPTVVESPIAHQYGLSGSLHARLMHRQSGFDGFLVPRPPGEAQIHIYIYPYGTNTLGHHPTKAIRLFTVRWTPCSIIAITGWQDNQHYRPPPDSLLFKSALFSIAQYTEVTVQSQIHHAILLVLVFFSASIPSGGSGGCVGYNLHLGES